MDPYPCFSLQRQMIQNISVDCFSFNTLISCFKVICSLDVVKVERSSIVGDITFDDFEQFSDNEITLTEGTYCKYISIARHEVDTGAITRRNHLPQISYQSPNAL